MQPLLVVHLLYKPTYVLSSLCERLVALQVDLLHPQVSEEALDFGVLVGGAHTRHADPGVDLFEGAELLCACILHIPESSYTCQAAISVSVTGSEGAGSLAVCRALARQVAFEAAQDHLLRKPLRCAPSGVGAGVRVYPESAYGAMCSAQFAALLAIKMRQVADVPCLATDYDGFVTQLCGRIHTLSCRTEERVSAHHNRTLTNRRSPPHRAQTSPRRLGG